MAVVSKTAVKIKPLPVTIRRDFVAGGVLNVGELVYIDSNGQVQQANASAAGTSHAIGIVLSVGTFGATAAAAGDAVSVALFGPVTGFTGMTPGALLYVSNTAGAVDTAAGTVSKIIGYAMSAETILLSMAAS